MPRSADARKEMDCVDRIQGRIPVIVQDDLDAVPRQVLGVF
jgi:hypothetical protein